MGEWLRGEKHHSSGTEVAIEDIALSLSEESVSKDHLHRGWNITDPVLRDQPISPVSTDSLVPCNGLLALNKSRGPSGRSLQTCSTELTAVNRLSCVQTCSDASVVNRSDV